jgi:hypothetical protein
MQNIYFLLPGRRAWCPLGRRRPLQSVGCNDQKLQKKHHDHHEENHPGNAEGARDDAGQKVDRDGKIEKAAHKIGEKQKRKAAHGVDEQLENLLDGRGEDFDKHIGRDNYSRNEQDRIEHFHFIT